MAKAKSKQNTKTPNKKLWTHDKKCKQVRVERE